MLSLTPCVEAVTTGKMALIHGRKFIGVDISDEYIAIAKERVETLNLEIQYET